MAVDPTISDEELAEAEARLAALEARVGPVRHPPMIIVPEDPLDIVRALARLAALEARAGLRQDRSR